MKTVVNITTLIACILFSISYSAISQPNPEDPNGEPIPPSVNQNSDLFKNGYSADVYLDDISINEFNCTGNREAQNIDADIIIFSNPTNGDISVKYAIENPTEKGHIRVFDVWDDRYIKLLLKHPHKVLYYFV